MGTNVPDTRMTRDEVVARLRALKWTDDHWHTENCGTCATLDAAIRLLSAPSPDGWQPIATAPKDGADILLTDGRTVTYGGWVTDMDQGAEYEGQLHCAGWWSVEGNLTPTHWMPLPPPIGAPSEEV